jgi:hypothetical protein
MLQRYGNLFGIVESMHPFLAFMEERICCFMQARNKASYLLQHVTLKRLADSGNTSARQ